MKRLFLAIIASLFLFGSSYADEGMWIPMLIGKNIEQMRQMGFKLSAEDIYSVNHASLKDAIVQFGRGCTGELISSQGLLITNHHCGFSSIQSHSSVEHDYLTDGFWAKTHAEELPNPGLTVRFLVRMEDVTDSVLAGVTSEMSEEQRNECIARNIKKVRSAVTDDIPGMEIDIKPFYFGNQYYMFIYQVFPDVRLVGAPPSSIGKFGGDTDNWVWPRHTGDFSLFRIYADKNNNPAPYSPDNVPYKPKKFLKISLKGVKENDFTLVYGFPGRTKQYLVSYGVIEVTKVINPFGIGLRDKRLKIFDKYMRMNDTVRIQYASKHARVANAWKKWIGESSGLMRLKAIEKKQEQESMFKAWANATPERKKRYGSLLPEFQRLYASLAYPTLFYTFRNEAFFAVELIRYAAAFERLVEGLKNATLDSASIVQSKKRLVDYSRWFFKNYNINIDKEMFAVMIGNLAKSLPAKIQPEFLQKLNADCKENWYLVADNFFGQTAFADSLRVLTLLDALDTSNVSLLLNDPIYKFYSGFETYYRAKIREPFYRKRDSLNLLYRIYVEGLMKMQPDKAFFPDANLTMRVTYGRVSGFEPRDGTVYRYYTTLKGIVEKSMQNDVPDYRAPKKLLELCKAKDYGQYSVNGTVPVAFIASNHTTGGNSGSPVLDAEGNLIGINFDRCWESTMSDIMFDPDYCRNISLDVHYALFIIDRFAGAKHLIDEMTIIR